MTALNVQKLYGEHNWRNIFNSVNGIMPVMSLSWIVFIMATTGLFLRRCQQCFPEYAAGRLFSATYRFKENDEEVDCHV